MLRRLGFSSLVLALLFAVPAASAQPAPAPAKPRYVTEDGLLKLPTPVTFEADSARLAPSADDALAYIARYLEDTPYITLARVEAHVAGAKGALALSKRRALAVARALVARGVKCERLIPVGFGDAKPVAPEGDAANTRIDVAAAHL
ncbi:MAG: hypothetical protein EP329_21870, partial [Deltaproteobacteria bacterium]